MRLRRRTSPPPEAGDLYDRAWLAHDSGDHAGAVQLMHRALELSPSSVYWFDLGLMHKWQREWEPTLHANLEAARLDPDSAEAYWNGGIAATALSEWDTARRLWRDYGITLLEGEGEPTEPLGRTPVRVDPDGAAEVVWCTRLDPARARIENVPTPTVHRRWGDVVLHDGEPKGERHDGDGWVPVFDEISLWRRSTTPRLRVVVEVAAPWHVDAVEEAALEAGWAAEDWTGGVRVLCRECSEGRPDPSHDHPPMDDWVPERELGMACPVETAAVLLDAWVAGAPGERDWHDLEQVD